MRPEARNTGAVLVVNPHRRRRDAARGIIAVVAGSAAAYALSLHVFGEFASNIATGLRAAALALGAALLTYLILFWVLPPRLGRLRRSVTIVVLAGALAAGIGVALCLPTPQPPTHHLELVATGRKNPAALGSEVWVKGLYLVDATPVPPRAFTLTGDWEIRSGVPISYRAQPATLRWSGRLKEIPEFTLPGAWRVQDGQAEYRADAEAGQTRHVNRDATLRLLSHPYSGIVRITWNDQVQTVDLYSSTTTDRIIPLPARHDPAGAAARDAAGTTLLVIDALGLTLLLFAAATIGLTRQRPPPQRRAPTARPVGWLVPAILAVLVTAGLWAVGLRDFVCHPGMLRLTIDAPGADTIPLQVDAAGRHLVDISLNRYRHEGQCAVLPDTPAHSLAFLGIMDDAGTLHPPDALDPTGPTDLAQLPGCPREAVWMDKDHLRAFSFTLVYQEARAVFYVPRGAASITRTVDGQTETVELEPTSKKLAYLSLRPARRPPGPHTCDVPLPPVWISRLSLLLPQSLPAVRVFGVHVSIPGVEELKPARPQPTSQAPADTDSPRVLELLRHVQYAPTMFIRLVGLFGLCAACWTLVFWSAARVWGTGRAAARPHRPVALWEGALVLLCVVGALWLQTAAPGFITNDGVAYVGRALECITTGQLAALAGTHPPGYAAFLAIIFLLGGDGATVWSVNAVLLALGLVGIWLLGRRLGGRVAGAVLVFWFAVNPILLIASRTVLPDFLYTLAVLAWFALGLAWTSSGTRGNWRWAILVGLGWAVLATIRPNAVTLLAAGIVVPFLAAGSLRRRAAAAACFFAVAAVAHLGLGMLTSTGPERQSRLGWGRTWPLLQRGWLAIDAPAFRPLRQDYLLARTQLDTQLSDALYYRLTYLSKYTADTDATLRATANASLRRQPRRAAREFRRCLYFAYVHPADQQLWQYLPWGFPNPARYEQIFDSHAERAGRWHGDAAQQRVGTFFTEHRAGSGIWNVFLWLHERTRDWRVWPISLLAMIGTAHAVRRREGILLLPGLLSLVCAVPLCLLFVAYDRYFLPAEVLLLLQAAVGIRAIRDGVRSRFGRPDQTAVGSPR